MTSNSMAGIRKLFFSPSVQTSGTDVLIYIFLQGGMDGLNVVVPHGDGYYHYSRPNIHLLQPYMDNAKSSIDLNGYFGLHPALAPLIKFYKNSSLAIVHAVGFSNPTHSHTQAQNYLDSGSVSQPLLNTGWIGRHLASKQSSNPSPLRGVSFGSVLAGSLRGSQSTAAFQSLSTFGLSGKAQDQVDYQNYLQGLYHSANTPALVSRTADQTQQALSVVDKINPLDYATTRYISYPQTAFGKALADTYMLINAGVGLEVACLEMGGWDSHVDEGNIFGSLNRQLTDLAQGITALVNDLGDRMKNVVIMTVSEFGRRVYENNSRGTDHGYGNAMFVLGGGVQGGKVYGTWPTLAPNMLVGPGDLAVTTDYRDVFAEVVKNRLGNPNLASVFPDYTPKPVGLTKPL